MTTTTAISDQALTRLREQFALERDAEDRADMAGRERKAIYCEGRIKGMTAAVAALLDVDEDQAYLILLGDADPQA